MTRPTDLPPTAGRALVLAGGGLLGIAWEIGALLGLRDAGIESTGWDRIVGTSAGAVVGAALGSADGLDRLIGSDWAANGSELAEHMAGLDRAAVARIDALWFGDGAGPDQATRAEIGRLARSTPTGRETTYLASIRRLLPTEEWPPTLCVTTVDALDGSRRVFDAGSGVPLVAAVAASSAIPGIFPPITLAGRPYIDGGVASGTSLELAAGCRAVLVLAPVRPDGHGDRQLADEVASLGATGSRVVVVRPAADRAGVFAADSLDVGGFMAAFAAGRASGAGAAEAWRAAIRA